MTTKGRPRFVACRYLLVSNDNEFYPRPPSCPLTTVNGPQFQNSSEGTITMRPSLKFIWDGRRKFQPRFVGLLVFCAVLLILISVGVTKYPAVYLVAYVLRDAACHATEILSFSLGELAYSNVTV
jgi:hypothetical protein